MFKVPKLYRWSVAALALGFVGAGSVSAETVAWWRMENGTAGTSVTGTQDVTSYEVGVPDVSGNGNHLIAENESGEAVLYSSDVPPIITGPNALSMQNSVNEVGGLMTWSAQSVPAQDIQLMEFEQFTVEAFIKPTATDLTQWTTFVGWDGAYDPPPPPIIELGSETAVYQYYRVTITEAAGGTDVLTHIAELNLLASDDSDVTEDNVTTVSASSEAYNPGNWDERAFYAYDGDQGTFWTANANLSVEPAWIMLELDTAAAIDSYQVVPRNGENARHPADWTLEGSNDGSTWTEIDVQSDVDFGEANIAQTLNFQTIGMNPVGTLRIQYVDATETRVNVDSPAPLVADNWYYIAGVMDGSELRLYMANLTEGEVEPTLVGTLALTSPDTRMLPRPDSSPNQGAPNPRASWTVGRGYYNSNEGDWVEGPIDEVRISNHAVDPSQMLLDIGVPVELSTFGIE